MRYAFLVAFLLPCSIAFTGEADVVDVKIRRAAQDTFDFDVTVKSVDRGWEYYADALEVLAPDGRLLR